MTKAVVKSAAPSITEAQAAEMFTQAYQNAVAGTRANLIFGAMYQWLGNVLSRNEAGRGEYQKGEGLKGWIEEKCPKVNYNTAYKWYKLAKAIGEEIGIPKGTDLYRLLTAPPHELTNKELKVRKEIDDAIEGKSARQLEIFTGVRKETRRIGAGEGNQNAKKDLTNDPEGQLAAAKLRIDMESSKAVDRLAKLIDNNSIAMLGLKAMRILADELDRLSKRTRDIMHETAKGVQI